MRQSPTLKRIAEKLNLSISTVSRALKDHPDISEETKKKVIELAELLEYDPNPYAINLRTHNSREFAIIVPSLSNFFYHSFISSVEEDARRYGYSVIIYGSSNDPAIELEILKSCKHKRVSGVFVAITADTVDIDPFLKLDEHGTPIIFFDKVPAYESCNKICVGDVHASTLAAEAILQKKSKHVLGIFGDQNMSITQIRLKNFKEVLLTNNPNIQLDIKHAKSSEESESIAMAELNSDKTDRVIFCMSDEILIGAMKAIQRKELKTPADIGVIGISNGMIPQLYFPEITYAETSGFKLGKLAFGRMMKCIAGSPFVQTMVDQSILIAGGSL